MNNEKTSTPMLPNNAQSYVEDFYIRLCETLTQWEQGEIDSFCLYYFLKELSETIENIAYIEVCKE